MAEGPQSGRMGATSNGREDNPATEWRQVGSIAYLAAAEVCTLGHAALESETDTAQAFRFGGLLEAPLDPHGSIGDGGDPPCSG